MDSFGLSYFLIVVIPVIVAVAIGIVLERIVTNLISSYGKRKGLPPSPVHLMKLLIRWVIVIVVIITVAGIFGIGLANLWIAISTIISMVIIGFFAVWSVLSNILATLIVMVWRPFQIGDKVAILPENLSGEIIDMNLIFSKLKTDEGDIINIPNNTWITKFTKIYTKK